MVTEVFQIDSSLPDIERATARGAFNNILIG
jgi:hypothetical protein